MNGPPCIRINNWSVEGNDLCPSCQWAVVRKSGHNRTIKCNAFGSLIREEVQMCNRYHHFAETTLDDFYRMAHFIIEDKPGRIGFKSNAMRVRDGQAPINPWDQTGG